MAVARARRLSSWRRRAPSLQPVAARLGWPTIAPGLVSFAVILSVGLAQGGLFPRSWRLAAFALWALAAAALFARERVAVSRLEWLAVGSLGAFTGWIALSALWSGNATSSLLYAERSLIYVAAMFAVCVLTERASLPHLLGGLLAAITALTGYGLYIYLFTSPPLDPVQGDLLFQPIGYANALGALVAIGILLSLGLALRERRRSTRLVALLPTLLLAPALYLTESRGAWLAFIAGLFFFLAFGVTVSMRWKVAAAALTTLVVGALIVVTGGAKPEQLAGENRVHYWRVAWNQFEANPLIGSGAGTYVDYWWNNRPNDSFARSAHSLYLQALGELGPVGIVLVLAALGLPFLALARRRDLITVTAASAYLAFVLHAAVDWDWELPAVPVAGVMCGCGLLVAARSASQRPLGLRWRLGLAAPALGLAALACFRLATGSEIPY